MRILFDQAAHDMRNKGNNSLLQAAVDRILDFWPDASLDLITVAPNLAKFYFPYIHPVSPDDLHRIESRLDNFQHFIPKSMLRILFELREEVWHRRSTTSQDKLPRIVKIFSNPNRKIVSKDINGVDAEVISTSEADQRQHTLEEAMSAYDLYLTSGGGYFCDHDKWLLLDLFDRLDAAISQGTKTVMVGLGVGPMEDAQLLTRAREIIPKVDLIFYRNRRLGLPLLESLGVELGKTMMTGDDAIEMAYDARPASLGTGIGVSLRVSSYTKVEQHQLEILRKVLHSAAKVHQAELIAVPISSAHHESDITHIRYVIDGYDHTSLSRIKLDTHFDAIDKASRCRLMISGTYHGAIFSLAQGIPVIGVAKSIEYYDKLAELSDEFGPGCQVLRLDDDQLSSRMTKAIDSAWSHAEGIRSHLLEAATRHIEWQHDAYRRIFELIRTNGPERPSVSFPTPIAQT